MNLREFQLVLNDMLIDFDTFCKENHLPYYLIGGSALGAKRHEGFIPWDDDVDVALLRRDFERLEQIIEGKLPAHLKYESVHEHSFPNAPMGFLYNISDPSIPLEQAPTIDVFALDGVPDSRIWRKVQKFFCSVYHLSVYRQPAQNRGERARKMTKLLIAVTPNFLFHFYRFLCKKIITRWKVEKQENLSNLFGMQGYDREIMPKSYLGTPKDLIFEGRPMPCPEDIDGYLTHLYGDYMQLPPKDKQIPHHKEYLFHKHSDKEEAE